MAEEGEITLRDVWNEMSSMRRELSARISDLADKVQSQDAAHGDDCDEKMETHRSALEDHSKRLNRLELLIYGCLIITAIGVSMWFGHLAGVVPGIGP
ncbi:MAG: hypothetical protein JET69_05515 [Methanomassiliicoccales archaeon]|nr:hypothetical protein [Methanomassiliicoccales archaeon]